MNGHDDVLRFINASIAWTGFVFDYAINGKEGVCPLASRSMNYPWTIPTAPSLSNQDHQPCILADSGGNETPEIIK